MEARLLKNKETQKAHKNTNNPPDKTPAFMDLKPFLFKSNLGVFFSVVNSQNYSQIPDMEIQKLYNLQI